MRGEPTAARAKLHAHLPKNEYPVKSLSSLRGELHLPPVQTGRQLGEAVLVIFKLDVAPLRAPGVGP